VTKRPALLVLALSVMALTGCGGSSSGADAASTPSPTHTQAPSSPPVTVTASPKKTTTVTASSTPVTTAAPCASSQLTLSLGQGQGAAGSFYTPIVLTNKTTVTCTLYGYPGVSYIASSGAEVGPAAAEAKGTKVTVTIKPGGAASALLHQPDPLVFSPSDCHKAKASGIRVYPPGQTASLTVSTKLTVCTTTKDISDITVMQPGTDPQQ
jgi:hypothetical protein